eukprot:3288868-Rhodomonas_salina.1
MPARHTRAGRGVEKGEGVEGEKDLLAELAALAVSLELAAPLLLSLRLHRFRLPLLQTLRPRQTERERREGGRERGSTHSVMSAFHGASALQHAKDALPSARLHNGGRSLSSTHPHTLTPSHPRATSQGVGQGGTWSKVVRSLPRRSTLRLNSCTSVSGFDDRRGVNALSLAHTRACA